MRLLQLRAGYLTLWLVVLGSCSSSKQNDRTAFGSLSGDSILAVAEPSQKGIKSISLYQGAQLISVSELDTAGNVIFWKDGHDDPIYTMAVNEFDPLNRKTRSYYIHSNTGMSISEYGYDSASNNILTTGYIFINNENHDDFNPYGYVSHYTTSHDVLSDPIIRRMIQRNAKHVVFKRKFDRYNHEIEEILFNDNSISQVTSSEYDLHHHLAKFSMKGEIGVWQIYYTYDSLGNLVRDKRFDERFGWTEEHRYRYNQQRQLIQERGLDKGEVEYQEDYFYEKGRKVRSDFYQPSDKLVSQTLYAYDKKDRVVVETHRDIRRNLVKVFQKVYEMY